MQIGRRIYFEKATGNLILDTGEREGVVRVTTIDQDFSMYAPLQNYVQEAVGMLPIPFGQDHDKFGQYAYHIDTATESIVWDLTPIQQEEVAKQQTLEEKVAHLEQADVTLSGDMTNLIESLAEKGVL